MRRTALLGLCAVSMAVSAAGAAAANAQVATFKLNGTFLKPNEFVSRTTYIFGPKPATREVCFWSFNNAGKIVRICQREPIPIAEDLESFGATTVKTEKWLFAPGLAVQEGHKLQAACSAALEFRANTPAQLGQEGKKFVVVWPEVEISTNITGEHCTVAGSFRSMGKLEAEYDNGTAELVFPKTPLAQTTLTSESGQPANLVARDKVELEPGETLEAADESNRRGNVVITQYGAPVAKGSPAFAGIELPSCTGFWPGTITSNGSSHDMATFTGPPTAECAESGFALSGAVRSVSIDGAGMASYTAALLYTVPGPCSYEFKKLSTLYPVPGDAIGEGEASGKLVKNGSSVSCAKSYTVSFVDELVSEGLETFMLEA